ncbi:MAG: F0F1 ATP synthase subunit delta [Candidatus Dormibacteraeota bacterium]|nr:F0F1 ATP synthase subunit delta [Candidatus Dormibacteraeota bacterium]
MAGGANRYAKAVFELATEQRKVEEWSGRLALIRNVLEDATARDILANPSVSLETRLKAVDELDLPGIGPHGLNLMRLLVASRRVDRIAEIVAHFEALADAAAGRVRARVTTAIPLSDRDREKLGRDLSAQLGKDVRLVASVDPAILGGLVLQVGDRLTDASVAGRIDQLRRKVLVK